MVSVVVETHATSENNEKGIASGWCDPPLSDTGLEQASRLGSRRANDGIAAVFCSHLQRATQPAHIAFQNVDIPIYIDPRLRECNYGALSGMPANEVTGPRGQHIDISHPEGESWREAVQRVQTFISELPDSSPDGFPAGLRNRVCRFDFCRGQTTGSERWSFCWGGNRCAIDPSVRGCQFVTDTADAFARDDPWGSGVPSELALLVGGLASGVAAKVADESGVSWLADLGTYPAVWVLVLATVATLAPTIPRAALRASAFFVGMSMGYYAWASFVLDFGWSAQAYLWLGVALTAVPVAAAAVRWATRRRGVLPGAMMAGIAGLALGSGAVRQVWLSAIGLFPGHTLRPVQAAFDLLMMVVVVGMLPRHSATRLWGAVLVIPLAVVAGRLAGVFYGLL